MPKRIENLQENILRQAKPLMLESGYEALAMRDVAARCGIAVGTLYNYFPSKEALAGGVMLEDWCASWRDASRRCWKNRPRPRRRSCFWRKTCLSARAARKWSLHRFWPPRSGCARRNDRPGRFWANKVFLLREAVL